MKRVDLIRHMERHGAQFLREGGNHSVYVNRKSGKVSAVPRHREINEFLAQKICRDLDQSRRAFALMALAHSLHTVCISKISFFLNSLPESSCPLC